MMKNSDIALGKAAITGTGVGTIVEPKTVEERLTALEAKIGVLVETATFSNKTRKRDTPKHDVNPDTNKDGIPFYLNLIGVTHGVPYVLTVTQDAYYLGNRPYATLSAAAKSVSGVRRSGWTFWKLPDGRTAKEAFKHATK